MSFDGIRKNTNRRHMKTALRTGVANRGAALRPRPKAQSNQPAPPKHSIKVKYRSIVTHIDKKQIATIAVTFVLTFTLSLATSQGLAKINSTESSAQTAAQAVSTTTTLPRSGELAVTTTPIMPQFENNVYNKPTEITLPEEKLTVPDPLKERKKFLEQYLRAKHSVLAEHVDALSEQTQWKLIIGIARAESSFCKKHSVNNCWGIGGAWNLKNYKNYDQAIADVNRILEQHYISAGLDSPGEIVNKWVGHPSENWETAVQEELDTLKNVP